MAMTGAVLGDQCLPSQSAALDAYYSGIAPVVTSGATSYANEFVKISDVWNMRQYSIDGAGVWTLRSTTAAPVPAFPSCDPSEPFMDGMAIGWGIATAMVAATAIVLMKRGARGG